MNDRITQRIRIALNMAGLQTIQSAIDFHFFHVSFFIFSLESFSLSLACQVYAKFGMDYESICRRVVANGEPGFAWLQNMREYGRMIDAPVSLSQEKNLNFFLKK